MTDERYKKIMADLGMPHSHSLLVALKQVANEVGQECAASLRQQLASRDAEVSELKNNVTICVVRIEELHQQLETERMRLAACGVVALSNTPESAAKARDMLPEYRSASCDDVARTVDREMELRQQLAAANHAHEFMSQQYLDALKERNQLRKDVAKLQETLHCKLTWKPS